MICRNCNQIIDDHARYCPNCGTLQQPYAQDEVSNTAPEGQTYQEQQTPPPYYYEQPDNGYYHQTGNTYQNQEETINSTPYLVFAILSTICCCIPLGIPAIVYASKISTAQQMGQMDEARDCAKKAKIFSIVAAAVMAVFAILYFALIIFANVSYIYY